MYRLSLAVTVVLWTVPACGSAVDPPAGTGADGGTVTMESGAPQPAGTTSETGNPTTTAESPNLREGQYLFALSLSLDPTLPLQYWAELEIEGEQLSLELVPVALPLGAAVQRQEPLPDFSLTVSAELQPDQSFRFSFDDYLVPAAANPVTGEELVLRGEFVSAPYEPDYLCGTFSGEITSPQQLPLEGSSFTGTFVDPDAPVLPAAFPLACYGE